VSTAHVSRQNSAARSSVACHFERKKHSTVTGAAESTAPPLEITGLAGRKDSFAGMRLGGNYINAQFSNQQAVRHIV
jgi:hypothetical protein